MGRRTVSNIAGRIGAGVVEPGLGEHSFLNLALLWLLGGYFDRGEQGLTMPAPSWVRGGEERVAGCGWKCSWATLTISVRDEPRADPIHTASEHGLSWYISLSICCYSVPTCC